MALLAVTLHDCLLKGIHGLRLDLRQDVCERLLQGLVQLQFPVLEHTEDLFDFAREGALQGAVLKGPWVEILQLVRVDKASILVFSIRVRYESL